MGPVHGNDVMRDKKEGQKKEPLEGQTYAIDKKNLWRVRPTQLTNVKRVGPTPSFSGENVFSYPSAWNHLTPLSGQVLRKRRHIFLF
jgi:hypothetical protein